MVLPNSLSSYYEKFLATGEVKCIDEEIPFEIPNGWQWERIGNIFETTSGSTPLSRNPDYYKNGNINWVRTTDLNNGILNKTEIQITSKAIIDYNLSILPQTSVCVAMYGGAGTIGKHCILHFDTTINQSVCAIQPNGFCNMDYIHTFIEYQRPFWMDFAAGSRKDPNINQLIIKHCLLPIPPQEEQLRIVTKLNQLYPYIYQYGNSQNRLNQINKEIWHSLKKSILQEAIQGKLVPQIAEEGTAQELLEPIRQEKLQLVKEGKLKKSALTDSIIFRGDDNKYFEKIGKTEQDITDEIPFDIPNTWVWVRHNDLFDISGGSQPPKSKFIEREKEGYIRLFQIRDYGSNPQPIYIPLSTASKISQKGDILLARYGASLGKVFYAEYGAYNVALAKVIPLYESRLIFQKYIFLYYCSSIYQNEIVNRSRCAQAGFNKEDLNSLLFPLPPLSEQYRIVEKYEKAIASIMRG
ncbi:MULTISPECIES: restriction endonuclease subunit S [Bacteroides]|uniref:restriction endonuclease subunit S n=1 Tax=Bacteroides TaxID=816 RepID=UPI00125F77A4|nr:restriction endonuclease subunit S [Bacteroides xylanisolvens]KAB6155818.1 restriction endonuclease subunit S [Bacteroides xylanisolvens]KAB6228494.1 restriction endonuclease subunit S [Bacteroides xylanisolvens]KAB6276692.1 restriction endonuclease subunit S [Bacteroides xylanisolvens]KAB6292535.1 restriction endonuclease subunit S [Bacteroides xylanisolvens]KAB6307299.1 restriction endonuclease subunit S [Bacteroides xylanisolvens]